MHPGCNLTNSTYSWPEVGTCTSHMRMLRKQHQNIPMLIFMVITIVEIQMPRKGESCKVELSSSLILYFCRPTKVEKIRQNTRARFVSICLMKLTMLIFDQIMVLYHRSRRSVGILHRCLMRRSNPHPNYRELWLSQPKAGRLHRNRVSNRVWKNLPGVGGSGAA